MGKRDEIAESYLMNVTTAETPNFVLLYNSQRFGPPTSQLEDGTQCHTIYGFSSKQSYDRFITNCPLLLKPYPLVGRYMQEQVALPNLMMHLIAVDVRSPTAPFVNAVSMQSVLVAQASKTNVIDIEFHLRLEDATYRVETPDGGGHEIHTADPSDPLPTSSDEATAVRVAGYVNGIR